MSTDRPIDNSQKLAPLAELIRSRMIERGWTFRDVEKRSDQAGQRVSHATVNNLANAVRHNLIREKTLRGLAVGLDLPFNVLAAASAQQAGYNLLDGGDVTTTLRSAASLQKVVEVTASLPPDHQARFATIAEQIDALPAALREEWFAKMQEHAEETAAQVARVRRTRRSAG